MTERTRYAVFGSSSGTGRAIVQALAEKKEGVLAFARRAQESSPFMHARAVDVTSREDVEAALRGHELEAVFFTVDIHGVFLSRQKVRSVVYQGLVNVVDVLSASEYPPKLVVLSPMGPHRPSWIWKMLGAFKPGIRQCVMDREQYLAASNVPHVLCRAPRLKDPGEEGDFQNVVVSPAARRLDLSTFVSRSQLAAAMIRLSQEPSSRSAWDIRAERSVSMVVRS